MFIGAAGVLTACSGGGGGDEDPPANSPPQITSAASVTFPENGTAIVYTVQASDPDGDAVNLSLSGPDASAFDFDSQNGTLTFANAPDFEEPSDINSDNIYEVTIIANDEISSSSLNIDITVTDVPGGTDFGSDVHLGDRGTFNGFVLFGANDSDLAGYSVASAGDVNDDGYTDIVIGAPTFELGTSASRGAAYVVYGQPTNQVADITLDDPSSYPGFAMSRTDSYYVVGVDVSGAGDLNGDNFDDVIIGSELTRSVPIIDKPYIIFGGPGLSRSDLDLTDIPIESGFSILDIGSTVGITVGQSVAGNGDVDGDGFDDIIFGAPVSGPPFDVPITTGRAYVILGAAGIGNQSIDLSDPSSYAGFFAYGGENYTRAGERVAIAGDVNGDGYDDVLVASNTLAREGVSWVIFGNANFPLDNFSLEYDRDSFDGFALIGATITDFAGVRDLGSAGDVNGDGYDDILVGAPGGDGIDGTQSNLGEAYVVFGSPGIGGADVEFADPESYDGFILYGADEFDQAGLSVAAAGDVNDDGFDDFIVAASEADGVTNNLPESGEVYVIFGAAGLGAASVNFADPTTYHGFTIYGAESGDQAGFSVSGAGDVNGDGFDDIVIGAIGGDGEDGSVSNAGEVYVIFGGAT